MNLVTKNIRNHQLFYESRLKEIFEPVLSGDFLRLADVVDDLRDVVHRLAQRIFTTVWVVEQ